jgi:hypothetical protein
MGARDASPSVEGVRSEENLDGETTKIIKGEVV